MRKPIHLWRISRAEPKGLHLWFDEKTERPRLYSLEPSTEERVLDVHGADDGSEKSGQSKQMFLSEDPSDG